jgi:hypothetical protein
MSSKGDRRVVDCWLDSQSLNGTDRGELFESVSPVRFYFSSFTRECALSQMSQMKATSSSFFLPAVTRPERWTFFVGDPARTPPVLYSTTQEFTHAMDRRNDGYTSSDPWRFDLTCGNSLLYTITVDSSRLVGTGGVAQAHRHRSQEKKEATTMQGGRGRKESKVCPAEAAAAFVVPTTMDLEAGQRPTRGNARDASTSTFSKRTIVSPTPLTARSSSVGSRLDLPLTNPEKK